MSPVEEHCLEQLTCDSVACSQEVVGKLYIVAIEFALYHPFEQDYFVS